MSGPRAQKPPAWRAKPALRRRELLLGASRTALCAALAGSASLALVACVTPRGEPWQDGTFWDDGTGWVE